MQAIRDVSDRGALDPFIIEIAEQMKQVDKDLALRALVNFAYRSAYFEADPPGRQWVRTPAALIREGKANCVDYTALISSVLKALNWPHLYRVVRFSSEQNFSHIYPVLEGISLDVVPFQSQTGTEHLTRKKGEKISPGVETPYYESQDYDPRNYPRSSGPPARRL